MINFNFTTKHKNYLIIPFNPQTVKTANTAETIATTTQLFEPQTAPKAPPTAAPIPEIITLFFRTFITLQELFNLKTYPNSYKLKFI